MDIQVKVCGMTRPEQVARLWDIGVSYAGFIFYPESPRYVLSGLTPEDIRKERRIGKVGVFVNAAIPDLLELAEACRLDRVQLHGDESPEYCAQVSVHLPVVKAFRLSGQEQLDQLLAPYRQMCEHFLFDTSGAGYGGTGKQFDWSLLNAVDHMKPFFLSGGIGPGDAHSIRGFREGPSGAFLSAVDINSRFETAPGVKDMQSVEAFIRTLNTGTND